MGNDISKIAVVYARYSSSGQREESIDGQLAAARKYADAKGYTIIHEYIDRAKTGRNDNREDFQRMLSDTAKKSFSVIIVWKVDRFGRNREELTFNKYRCKKNGVRVEYVAENMPEGPESVILESVLEGMAEYYSLQLSQNVKRGMLENAKQYKAVSGAAPIGYRIGADKHFEIDPKTAPIVRVIFERYASGETLFELIDYLNAHGYKTRHGKPFQRSSLDKTLKNEQYIGTYTYKDIIRAEDVIPPIIDKETFHKVQDMLKKNRREPAHQWKYSDYLLTGKLFCGICGASMVGKAGHGKAGKKYGYYACKAHLDNAGCGKHAIRQDYLEDAIMREVTAILRDDDLLDYIADQTWQFYQEQDAAQTEAKALEKQLADLEKASANLLRAIESGLPFDSVRERLEELECEKMAIKKALAEIDLARGFRLTRDHIAYFLYRMRDLDMQDQSCQKKLIDIFVNAIYLTDDAVQIAFNYTDSGSSPVDLSLIKQNENGEHHRSVRTCPLKCGQVDIMRTLTQQPMIIWLDSVFVLSYQLPA